ncbi:hypothetical protein EDB89DRAFT_2229583, partial [Lactarius sanguifluus]
MGVQVILLSIVGVPGALLAGWAVELPFLVRANAVASEDDPLTGKAPVTNCLYIPIASRWCILMISLLDVVCFYDWVISLDREVALIYPAPWNAVKAAYLFCRYYPMAIAPFHLWGLVGDHEKRVCETIYRVLYACAMPTLLSAQFILMLRTYAFSGRKTRVLVALSITYLCLVGVIIWVLSKELTRLCRRPC